MPRGKSGPRAVLPRGVGLAVEDEDHHVLQVGFDLGTPPWGAPQSPPAM